MHPLPPSSFQSPPSTLQHPQQYLNQNIAPNLAISPNLGQKIKSYPFSLKIGTHGILEVLIPNPDLKFRPQNPFLGKFGPKNSKVFVLSENWYTWYLKDADSRSGPWIFGIPTPKPTFGQILVEKVNVVCFS